MGSSCEGDALILCCLLGCAVNFFDRQPQHGAVGPVVYAHPTTLIPMEQTDGRCPGTQLSRGERPILK